MRGFILLNARRFFLPITIHHQPPRFQCTSSNSNKIAQQGNEKSIKDSDVYKQLENLDFMTATKILFTTPPEKKEFGLDFHLVQLFFVCMPSLAVYLLAQYARYEIKRMEAEEEAKKKKAEEEEMAIEIEELALEEERRKSDPEFLQVKNRLDALEETLKEIVVETKKQTGSSSTKDQENAQHKEEHAAVKTTKSANKSEDSNSAVDEYLPRLSPSPSKPAPVIGEPVRDQGKAKP